MQDPDHQDIFVRSSLFNKQTYQLIYRNLKDSPTSNPSHPQTNAKTGPNIA